MANPIFVIDIGPDGVVATHPNRLLLPVMVAPVPEETKAKDFNAIRPQLIAIGCMKLPGRGFDFDSSFVSPSSQGKFQKFADLMIALQAQDTEERFPPCSVFGHADPTGNDGYNKDLSGRRARAIYGLLIRDWKIWDELFRIPLGGDRWGLRSIRRMLSISLQTGEAAFYAGPLEGANAKEKSAIDDQTRKALIEYKKKRFGGAGHSGTPDTKTKEKLFLEYMNAICHDGEGNSFQLAPTDFLCKDKDTKKGHKGDVQGCGEFNPIFLLSKDQEKAAKTDKVLEAVRNEVYRADRRAVVYIFKHGTEIDPEKWPCPRSTEDGAGCKLRFWSDGDKRRSPGEDQRTFGVKMDLFERDTNGDLALDAGGKPTTIEVQKTGNTLACRWYHAFAIHSPCERKVEEWIIRFRVDAGKKKPEFLANRRYVLLAGETGFAPEIRGSTDEHGELRIPVFDEHVKMKLKVDAWDALLAIPQDTGGAAPPPADMSKSEDGTFKGESRFISMELDCGALRQMSADENELPGKQRLYNLGFGHQLPAAWTDDEFKAAVRRYRLQQDLGDNTALDGPTREAIVNEHEGTVEPAPDDDDDSSE